MAVSTKTLSWRDQLNSHPICKRLKETTGKDSAHKQHNDSKSLICIHGTDMYIWDSAVGRLLHCNLKTLAQHQETNVNENRTPSITNLRTKLDDSLTYQKLLLTDGFSLDVEAISANRSGSHIAVWGAHCIRIVELPRRWGKNAMFQGGRESISCRTVTIGERTFKGTHSLRIRQVSWHPGSKTDSHLAVLASDNTFSVYDIQDPEQPLSIINISTGDVSFACSPGKSFVGSALGETGVAFDFGSPVTIKPKEKMLQSSSNKTPSIQAWPVYCVRGSGDVMLLYSHLSPYRQLKLPVQGPLMMYPPADDNYGVDACSILCLTSTFTLIIISTCEGRVHHCLQLPGSGDDESLLSDTSAISNVSQGSTANLYEGLTEPILFVIETAELELCLTMPRFDGETELEDDFMCPVRLKKDANSPDRYHCVHAAGVHSVALPWFNTVQQYYMEESADFSMPEEKECVVEHVLCTKPLFSCPTSPILGLDVVSDSMLGPTLVILSSDYEFTALPIGLQYQMPAPSQDSDRKDNVTALSSQRHVPREPFSKQVEQILMKKTSNPLLKCSSSTQLSQQDCFQLLSRATQVLREEYIHRQDHARQEIDTRMAILREHKEHQLHDIKKLMESRPMLREHARTIAEKLENSKEDNDRLLKRLEVVLRKLQSRVPALSEAEKQMMRELAKIKDNMQLYEQNIEQLRVKQDYQERQTSRAGGNGNMPVLQKRQLTQIHNVLSEEGGDIEELKKDISRLNISLS